MPVPPLQARAILWIPAVAWAAIIFGLSGQPQPPQPPGAEGIPYIDKLQHMVEYGILTVLLLFAIRRSHREPGWAAAAYDPLIAVTIAVVYGATDELHQAFVPPRIADAGDWVFDSLGAIVFGLGFSAYITPRPEPIGGSTHSLSLPQGRVAYWSDGEGPAILHIHGWRGSKRYFEDAPARVPGHRHIAIDLLGFGDSDKPARFGYAPADQARVARAAMRRLGVEHATVVGHSMGGAVALALYRLDPAFVERLVLVEPALNLGLPPPFPVTLAQARSAGLAVSRMGKGDALAMARAIVARPDALDQRFIRDAMKAPFHASAASLTRLAMDSGALVAPAPDVPLLLLFGDPAFQVRAAYAEHLASQLGGVTVHHVANTSHCPMIEDPDTFWGLVRDFVAGAGQADGADP